MKLVLFPTKKPTGTAYIWKLKSPQTGTLNDFLITEDSFFHVTKYQFSAPSSKVSAAKNGDPLRSAFYINESDRIHGHVDQDSSALIAQEYNFAYILIDLVTKQSLTDKFLSKHDFCERLFENIDDELVPLVASLVERTLPLVSECITEGDEQFYKVTQIVPFLQEKVSQIVSHFPASVLHIIKNKLYPVDIDDTIPEDVLQAGKTKYACLLISSCVDAKLLAELESQYDFSKLKEYQDKLEKDRMRKQVAEEAIQSVKPAGKRKAPAKPAAKPVAKKPRVAKGAGAIDSFFKKAK